MNDDVSDKDKARAEKKLARQAAFAEKFERTRHRRLLMETAPNPSPHMDYVVTLRTELVLPLQNQPLELILRYIPDKTIMHPDAVDRYLVQVKREHWDSIEEVASAITEDFKNEIIARWARLTIRGKAILGGIEGEHTIIAEETQPGWNDKGMLNRIGLD